MNEWECTVANYYTGANCTVLIFRKDTVNHIKIVMDGDRRGAFVVGRYYTFMVADVK